MNTSVSGQSVKFQKTSQSTEAFLKEMLYMALYVPDNEPLFPKAILEKPELRKYIDNFGCRQKDIAIIARIEKETVGIVWGRLFSAIRPSYGFISEAIPEITMTVMPSYRNKGIGGNLLDKISEYYKEKKIKAISLSVDKRSPALELYKRKGFELFSEKGTSMTMVRHL